MGRDNEASTSESPTPSRSHSDSEVVLDAPSITPSWRSIFGVALPASVFNVASPLLSTGQTSLLGRHREGAIALAAYGSVWTTISLASRLSAFLCDASSAKCGAAIGARDWNRLARDIKMSLAYAILLGIGSVIILGALKPFVFRSILSLRGDVLVAAEQYFGLALWKVPFSLVGLSVSGTLQGFRQANAVAMSTTFFSVLEFCVDCAAVYLWTAGPLLWTFGVIGIFVAALQTTWGVIMLLTLKPVEADDGFSLRERLLDSGLAEDAPTRVSNEDLNDVGTVEDDGTPSREESRSIGWFKNGMTDMLIRSLIMQGTFALALFWVSKMPSSTTTLAAHHIITNIWMLISYFVDGFSAASIVLGSRLRAQSDKRALLQLTGRCLAAGLVAGLVTCIGLLAAREHILDFYLGKDGAMTRASLGTVWLLLASVQPLNGVVFVLDGMLCGGQDFKYISRAYMVGFVFVFLPLILSPLNSSLFGVWLTKALFNLYRCSAAVWWVKTRVL